jgi:hypothetical protein
LRILHILLSPKSFGKERPKMDWTRRGEDLDDFFPSLVQGPNLSSLSTRSLGGGRSFGFWIQLVCFTFFLRAVPPVFRGGEVFSVLAARALVKAR